MAMNVTPFQSSDNFNMTGFNNMISQINSGVDSEIESVNEQITSMPRVVFGSYVGTGKYGERYPNSITFDFAPKFVCVSINDGVVVDTSAIDKTTGAFVTAWATAPSWSQGFGYSTKSKGRKSTDGKTISWYTKEDNDAYGPKYQLNESGKTYYYMAIG